jgi:transcriptional regulator with GAF, ATPase, and Fis domain
VVIPEIANEPAKSEPAEPEPAPAAPEGKEETVAPTLVTADPFAAPSAAAGPALDARGKEVKQTRRLSGDDLLSDLFEAMHDVHFQPGLLEGVHFVLSLAVEKMPCRAAICHLFDINRREFVVAHALGERRADLLLKRVSEREPLLQQVLRRRRAVVMNAGDPLLAGERWGAIGQQVQSAVSAPVVLGGRFLGVLELVNPMDGKPFSEGDGYALAYMGEQFAEFLGQRGLLLDPEAILAFKPPRL